MSDNYYRGLGMEYLKEVAEEGVIPGIPFEDWEMFEKMRPEKEVYGKDRVVWMTEDLRGAKVYAREGGVLEINGSNLKVIEDRNSSYAVAMRDVGLEHVESILVAETRDNRDHLLEIGGALNPEHGGIIVESYEPPRFEV